MTAALHWLVKAAVDIGIVQPQQLTATATTRAAIVWDEIERVSGVAESELVDRIAQRLRVPVGKLVPDPHALKVVPEKIARQHAVLPLRESDARLIVATSDPMDFSAEQALTFASGRTVEFELAGPRAIERLLREYYSADSVDALVAGLDDSLADAVVALHD